MSEETPNFSIDPQGGMNPPAEFTHNGHHVEIVPPDTDHLIGKYWQIKIDDILQQDLLFCSARMAADPSEKIDRPAEVIDQPPEGLVRLILVWRFEG